jgi:hypothetical protein
MKLPQTSEDIKNEILISSDTPGDLRLRQLIVVLENGIEIKGQAINIEGMDCDSFDVTILGISYPFFEEEFPHHIRAYNDQFKDSE